MSREKETNDKSEEFGHAPNEPHDSWGRPVKTFRVAICLEEGFVITVKANNEEEALKKADEIGSEYGGSDYPKEYEGKHVHRDWFSQDAEEVQA